MKPFANAYHLLGAISHREGKTAEAKELFRKGISTSDDLMRTISITEDLAECEHGDGNYAEEARLLELATNMRDSMARENTADSIAALQMAHDMRQAEIAAEQESSRAMAAMTVIIVTAAAGCASLAIYTRRTRKSMRSIQRQAANRERLITEYKDKLRKAREEDKKEAETLRKAIGKLERKHEKDMAELDRKKEEVTANGHKLYETARRGGNISQWNKNEMRWFAEYYMAVDNGFRDEAGTRYSRLTARQTVFVILVRMGKSTEEIKSMMAISGDSLRKLRSAVNARKTPDSMEEKQE